MQTLANTTLPTGGITIPATPPVTGGSDKSAAGGYTSILDDLSYTSPSAKRVKLEISSNTAALDDDSIDVAASETSSTSLNVTNSETFTPTQQQQQLQQQQNEDSENEALIVDCESPMQHGNDSPSKLHFCFVFNILLTCCQSLMIYLNNFIRFL